MCTRIGLKEMSFIAQSHLGTPRAKNESKCTFQEEGLMHDCLLAINYEALVSTFSLQ